MANLLTNNISHLHNEAYTLQQAGHSQQATQLYIQAVNNSDAMPIVLAESIHKAKQLMEWEMKLSEWKATSAEISTLREKATITHNQTSTPPLTVSAAQASSAQAAEILKISEPVLIQASSIQLEREQISKQELFTFKAQALATTYGQVPLLLNGSVKQQQQLGSIAVPCSVFVDYLLQQQDTKQNDTTTTTKTKTESKATKDHITNLNSTTTSSTSTPTDLDLFTLCVFDAQVLDPRYATTTLPTLYTPPNVPFLELRARLLERLHPSVRPDTRWLLLGPQRSGTKIHTDPVGTNAWNYCCSGIKRWALVSPEASSALIKRDTAPDGFTWTIMEWFDKEWPSIVIDAEKQGCTTYDFLQRPGETVCIPNGWWHSVVNVESSIAITENYVRAEVLQKVVDEACDVGDGNGAILGRKQIVIDAIIQFLDLVEEEDEEVDWLELHKDGIWSWLFEMHKDGIIKLPVDVDMEKNQQQQQEQLQSDDTNTKN